MQLNKPIKLTLFCLGLHMSCTGAFASVKDFKIHIAATDAVTALNELASQTDLPLLFDFDQLRDTRVNALKGTYTLQEALDLILRDTGFSGNLMNREVIMISPIKPIETHIEENPMIFKGTKTKLLSGASAALVAMAATPVSVQAQAADQPVEEIIATGIRQSLKAAADLKRADSRIVDAIVAEDIGKLPDNNIAEALQRITGVSINTDFGVGDSVSIRGLSQNRVELNGRTTLGDDRDGVSLQDIPSAFLKSVEVIKSPTADMIEGALGGTVRMNTVRPLELRKPTIAGSLDLEYADKTANWAPIANVSAGNVWDLEGGGTFGAIAMISYQNRELRQDEYYNRVIYQSPNDSDGVPIPGLAHLTSPHASGNFTLRDQPTLNQFVEERERTALNLSLQYAPASDRGNVYLDLSTSERAGSQAGNSILDVGGTYVFDSNTTVDGNGDLNNYGIENVFAIPKTWSEFRNTESYSHALGGDWDFTDDINVSAEYSIASSSSNNPDSEFNLRPIHKDLWQDWAATYVVGDGFPEGDLRAFADQSFAQTGDALPSITYNAEDSDAYLAGDRLALRAFWSDDVRTENDETAVKFDVEYTDAFGIDFLTSLKAGARFTTNDYTYSLSRYRADNIYRTAFSDYGTVDQAPFALWIEDLEALVPGSTQIYSYNDTFSQLGLSGPNQLTSYRTFRGDLLSDAQGTFELVQDLFAGTNIEVEGTLSDNQVLDEGAFRDITEETGAFYVSGDFEFDRIKGNAGVRYVTTDIESDVVVLGDRTSETNSYSDVLPSLNVSYDIDDNTIARFAAAKVMRRANYADLSSAIAVNAHVYAGTQGRVDLEPYRATQYDFSVERYLGNGGLISGAIFYKDVESFLTGSESCLADVRTSTLQNTTEFEGICLLDTAGVSQTNIVTPNASDYATSDEGTIAVGLLAADGLTGVRTTTSQNGEDGRVLGFELGLQYQLDFLPSIWSGLGFNGNYTYADSEQPNGNALLDISEHTLNTQIYWENDVFQARLAYNWRSDFLDTELETRVNRIGSSAGADGTEPLGNNYREARGQLDFSTAYDVNDHLTLVGTATNLTGEPSIYSTELGGNWQYREADRRFAVGARFTY